MKEITNATNKSPFDIPIILPAAFWSALTGIVIERSKIIFDSFKLIRKTFGMVAPLAWFSSSLLLNFASILCAILTLYYCFKIITGTSAIRKIAAIVVTLLIIFSDAVLLSCMFNEATTNSIIFAQSMAYATNILLVAIFLREKTTWFQSFLLVLPVLSLSIIQFNQFFYFFPQILPFSNKIFASAFMHLIGQLLYFTFVILVLLGIFKHNKFSLQSFAFPLIAGIIAFISLSAVILLSEKSRNIFLMIVECRYFLTPSLITYPLIASIVVFILSLSITDKRKTDENRYPRQRGYLSLGLVTISFLIPVINYYSIIFSAGMILWLWNLTRLKDF